jgi:hypothetical protein
MRMSRQPGNHRLAKIQKCRSLSVSRGRNCRRRRTSSCCRRHKFSATNDALDLQQPPSPPREHWPLWSFSRKAEAGRTTRLQQFCALHGPSTGLIPGSRDTLYYSPITLRFEFLRRLGDGEPVIWGYGVSPSAHHSHDKVIKAGPEMVDNLADDDGETRPQRALFETLPDICSAFVLRLSNNSIGLWVNGQKNCRARL